MSKIKFSEKDLIHVQRNFRAEQRRDEEEKRIIERFSVSQDEAKKIMADANTAYRPQCHETLSERIQRIAEDVKLFSIIRHLTSEEHISNILDNALYGRRTLLQFNTPFKPAALGDVDIRQGDYNVICMGPQEIDSTLNSSIEFVFNLDKLDQDNPCAFYKQRDFGFDNPNNWSIRLGNSEFQFNTSTISKHKDELALMTGLLTTSNNTLINFDSKVRNSALIAYNLPKMHQISILNFFRFIDTLEVKNQDVSNSNDVKKLIYDELAKLSDDELKETLLKIGNGMTATMEFNFYGAHKINFDSLENINKVEKKEGKLNATYQLEIKSFIEQLQAGNLNTLNEAKNNIPNAFKSYRFIDYLLDKVNHTNSRDALLACREKCQPPQWIRPTIK